MVWVGEASAESLRERVLRASRTVVPRGAGHGEVWANLASVVERGAAEDLRQLARLVSEQGPERVAALQREVDGLLGWGERLPVTTAAVVAMCDRQRMREVLVADGASTSEAAAVADAVERQAWYLLVSGIDSSGSASEPSPSPRVGTADTFDAARWRLLLGPLLTAPWSGRADQLQREVLASQDAWLVRLLEGCSIVIRELQTEWDRQAIAREIRRLVASSGVTQRDFSALVGTSQSRFSTYINGRVTPSATMMLRISRTARTLRARAAGAPDPEVRSAS